MILQKIREKEETLFSEKPHLSYSKINRYLLCPEQFRLYYVEGLRLEVPPVSLVFGQFIHQSLAYYFNKSGDPVVYFTKLWEQVKDARIKYKCRESWESLKERGERLLTIFLNEEMKHLTNVQASEKPFELTINSLKQPLVGIIDLVGEYMGTKTVVDFKTSSASYEGYEIGLSDQLTSYILAEPDAEKCAYCVLIKAKESRIEWLTAKRNPEQISLYLQKVKIIGAEIESGKFYRRPGKWCAWCDYLALCMGYKQQADSMLTCIKNDH